MLYACYCLASIGLRFIEDYSTIKKLILYKRWFPYRVHKNYLKHIIFLLITQVLMIQKKKKIEDLVQNIIKPLVLFSNFY